MRKKPIRLMLTVSLILACLMLIGSAVYVMITGGLKVGDIVYPIDLAEPLGTDGIAAGTLVTEELSPIELFFN